MPSRHTIASQSRRGITIVGLAAAAFATPTRADTVRVKKTVQPAILLTTYAGRGELSDDFGTCALFQGCHAGPDGLDVTGIPPQPGTVVVGFNNFVFDSNATCLCSGFASVAFRGEVDFKTMDVPSDFATATLVLDATRGGAFPDFTAEMVNFLFKSAPALPFEADDNLRTPLAAVADLHNPKSFSGLALAIDPVANQVTALRQIASFPLQNQDPTLPQTNLVYAIDPTNTKVKKSEANYRLDVTNTVRGWAADNTPVHGFILVAGPGQVTSDVRWAMYKVTLEFDIDEPVR
jgi:hypothetical protein